MNKRLMMLEQMTSSSSADAFAWYALAMEYKKEGRLEDAVKTFEKLRDREPQYLPMYLMAGQTLLELEQPDQARVWLEQGIELARQQQDSKTLGELEDALAQV